MLQARINELNSGIINITENKVRLTGFYNSQRLFTFETKDIDNWSSKGLYDFEEIQFSDIKSGALFVLQSNGKEISRHQFNRVLRDTAEYVNEKGKKAALTFEIRKSEYSSDYNLKTKDNSVLFENLLEIKEYMIQTFNYEFNIEEE